VIPTWNGRELLGPCLSSVFAHRPPRTEVIVVDNGSTDNTSAWMRQRHPDVGLVELGANRGYAAACNAGMRASHGACLIFLNNDVVVQPGWAQALVDALRNDPEVVIAGGLTLYSDPPSLVNSAGIRIARSLAGTDVGLNGPLLDVSRDAADAAAVSGVNMAVEREWLETAGGFEESFFMYYEDVELCLRAWVLGRRVRYVPDSIVLHASGATAGSREGRARHHHSTRNRLLCSAKLLEARHVPLAWALSVMEDLGAVVWHLLHGRFAMGLSAAHGKATGLASAVRALPDLKLRRRQVAALRVRPDAALHRLGLIQPVRASLSEYVRFRLLVNRLSQAADQ
jgi:GT2 family glycosyltransferase